MSKATKQFQTEVKQLLDLVIHSLYSNRDIFLRELISNASDAIDKARFEAQSNESLLEGNSDWKIKLIPNKDAGTLTIRDNGIGMSMAEVEENIGTIAKSGTKSFVQAMKDAAAAQQPELIGQFGVGFYASFMVADKVTLTTRRAGDAAHGTCWESIGDGSYTIEDCTKAERGTEIVLHLKEEFKEYLDEWKIRSIVKKYSDFIQYPVCMDITRTETPKGVDGEEIEGAGTIEKIEEQTLNSMKAIWARPKSEVTEEEYKEFYKHVSHDFDDPFKTIHFAAEGTSEFKALLYLPAKKPFDLFMAERKRGIQLYVKRVFITEKCDALLPDYLRFVRGVVDSSDLPLNVSREILQEDVQIKRIQKSLVNKILSTLADLKEKEYDQYLTFWKEFGPVLKEGLHFDYANKEKLQELMLFQSTRTAEGEYVSLKEYVERMPEAQKEIYYITGEDKSSLEQSPLLEAFNAKGFEVLFLTDPVDEWVVQSLHEYQEKKLKAVDRGDVDLDSEDEKKEKEKKQEEAKKEFGSLLELIKGRLESKIKEVRFSNRLTDSACCLVADDFGMNANMERIMKAMNQAVPESKRVLELNPDHPIVKVMGDMYKQNPENSRLLDYSDLLYDQALLTEGTPIKDPLKFTKLVSELMVKAAQ
ncbi:molecular chaperone HtpG [Trichlorobacter lovleyi]|uniref:Chaperone protein HtpG n=1 Tax=Trichlorobacter lovleyi (strain ATCC BAA-1151 / DSM 17278 / SZ) TaxID=398767 RepID=B3E438_TRIL1|nr:molecular chaperone HtpG [Trichlorobacter lovleyi]ACD95859.1 heat shock protein Hsp90 [Trichlorobacter lovleyi SZ]